MLYSNLLTDVLGERDQARARERELEAAAEGKEGTDAALVSEHAAAPAALEVTSRFVRNLTIR